MKFYDTNILLYGNTQFLNEEKFCISNITIQELENIKHSFHKDENVKYKARQIIKWLVKNESKYQVQFYKQQEIEQFFNHSLPFDTIDNNDKKIILTAYYFSKKNNIPNFIFYTYDLNCYLLAKQIGLNSQYHFFKKGQKYLGFSKIYTHTDQQLSDLYTKLFSGTFGEEYFNKNEYLLIYNSNQQLIDKYKYLGNNGFSKVQFNVIENKMFGKIKPIDPYQELLIDSFKNNQLILVKGPAGTGKSLLSIAYLFSLLEEGKIDKIIIFCNTVATAGSAKLGFYPGTRTQKLLDSQIGNFLISKLGDRIQVERLIEQNQLLLLPMSDIRGFDTSGMRAGIYITQAQNLHVDLMKLALQRVGEDSICILDGDNQAQVDLDLYKGDNNGIKRVSEVFRGESFYGQVTLQTIHRSKIANVASKM